jgi:hypothetical protein
MKTTIKEELTSYVLDLINDNVLTDDNRDDWHHLAFNEDYYIIGYYQASEWLKKHSIDSFEAVSICQQYEIDQFGEVGKSYDNSEKTVNMLVYIYGEEIIEAINLTDKDTIIDLAEDLKYQVKCEVGYILG